MNQTVKVALIQMVSTPDVRENIELMSQWVAYAAKEGAHWVVLPEYWPIMGMHDSDKCQWAEPLGCGLLQDTLSTLAKEYGIVLFGGSIPIQCPDPSKVYNTLLVFDEKGQCISLYHKMHLFGFTGLGQHFKESDTIVAGEDVPSLTIGNIKIAQGVCYDLRFPEFFRSQLPFDVLVLPAAFTYVTGEAHWEVLLRARAIENQCFVLAAAQGGYHQNKRRTYGHSMVISPWGEVLASVAEGAACLLASLDFNAIKTIRKNLPALNNRVL